MSINFLGVGSGLELQTMLNQLVQVATEPKVEQLGTKERQVNQQISGLGSIKSALSEFEDSIEALNASSLYGKNSAEITQPSSGDVISVTAANNAVPGNYDISVEKLATSSVAQSGTQVADTSVAEGNSGNLTFAANGKSFSVAMSATDSLDALVEKINDASDNFGVSATVVDGRLVYKSSETGTGNDISVTNDSASLDAYSTVANGGGAGGMSITTSAQDAEIIVDGITITNSSNTFENSVTGLTITAKAADPGNNAGVAISEDRGSVKSAVETMVTAYNKVITTLNEQSGTTDEDGKFTAGPMFGNSIVRQIDGMMAGAITSVVSATGSNSFNSMYSIGLDLQSDGQIEIDSDRLDGALASNFDEFSTLFTGSDGFAKSMASQLESYLEFDGILDSVDKGYDQQIDDITQQYQDHIEYVTQYKETLTKQFAALDSTIATMNATMSYVQQQLSQLRAQTST